MKDFLLQAFVLFIIIAMAWAVYFVLPYLYKKLEKRS